MTLRNLFVGSAVEEGGGGSVAFDTGVINDAGTGTTVSQAITVADNPNRILIAVVGSGEAPALSVTGVAYTSGSGGTWSSIGVLGGDDRITEFWASIGPSTGSVTAQATFSGAANGGSVLALISLHGALQTSVAAACTNYTENNTSGVVSLTVTTATDGMAIVVCQSNSSIGAIVNGTQAFTPAGPTIRNGGYRSDNAGSTVISWTTSTPGRGIGGFNVNPAA